MESHRRPLIGPLVGPMASANISSFGCKKITRWRCLSVSRHVSGFRILLRFLPPPPPPPPVPPPPFLLLLLLYLFLGIISVIIFRFVFPPFRRGPYFRISVTS